MLLMDFLGVLYEETPVEICIDYEPVFTGVVEDIPTDRFASSIVLEAYISLDGKTLVVSINGQRNSKKK